MKIPQLNLEFKEVHDGYWNGGAKKGGIFEIDKTSWYRTTLTKKGELAYARKSAKHLGPGYTIRWGCYALNFWFTCGSGRSFKEAASIAKRKLDKMLEVEGTITTEWVEE